MSWLQNVKYSIDYTKPKYFVKLDIRVKRGILLKIAERTNTRIKDEELIRVPPENYPHFNKVLKNVLDEIEKQLQTTKGHSDFQFFSIDIKDIVMEKDTDKHYSIKVSVEGITPYV